MYRSIRAHSYLSQYSATSSGAKHASRIEFCESGTTNAMSTSSNVLTPLSNAFSISIPSWNEWGVG